MATNIEQLKVALTEYHEGTEQHTTILREQFEELQPLWQALRQEYGGHDANELLESWEITAQWFEDYIEATRRVNIFLEDRIKHLNNV